MQKKKVINVDHGNRNVKTNNHAFPASFMESGHLPSMDADTLVFKGKEYVLVDRRMPQKTDKTVDEDYFILTLLAIGKEIMSDTDIHSGTQSGELVDVVLLVGLPPLHCKEFSTKFSRYFKRDKTISFSYNGLHIAINIVDVHVFPQAYSAAITILERIKDMHTVNIVDIGGYTVDLLQLTNMRPNMSLCTSLYFGANMLFQKINEQVRAKGANNIPDAVIEGILMEDKKVLHDSTHERITLVLSCAEAFVRDMLLEVSQTGIELTENRTVFVGGGSILLKVYIEKTGMVAKPLFVDNVHANAEGYLLLYQNRNPV